MSDLWPGSGYALLSRDDAGGLRPTDDFLRTYYTRPELAPIESSCAAERALHRSLIEAPRRAVGAAELEAVQDADARENYVVMLRFRERLLSHATLQSFYASLFTDDVSVPPDFVHHVVQLIVRSLLEGCRDGLVARAGELFFREQRVTVEDGIVMCADAQTVEMQAATAGLGDIGRMLVQVQAPLTPVTLDVLDAHNADEYWPRNEHRDFVIALNPGRPGATALAHMLELWIGHFHGLECRVTPVREIPDEEWEWHIGLDVEATAMLNAIYAGGEIGPERMRRMIGLFRVEFSQPDALRGVTGGCVFLGLAMRLDGGLRMKPQNLLVNLPVAYA
jgi:hypothetical protein